MSTYLFIYPLATYYLPTYRCMYICYQHAYYQLETYISPIYLLLIYLLAYYTMCYMAQSMTRYLYNMFSCCMGVIWKSKVVPLNIILFGATNIVINSNLQEFGALFLDTFLWQLPMTFQMVVKWFGTFLQWAMGRGRWMGPGLYYKEKSRRNISNLKDTSCKMQMKLSSSWQLKKTNTMLPIQLHTKTLTNYFGM